MAIYPKAIVKLIPSAVDGPIKPRLAILHVAVSEADSLYSYFRDRSGGIESHFYVRYDGTVEQYRDTLLQADANMSANDFAVSIETEGLGDGTWTDAQVQSIKDLLSWLHTEHAIPLVVPTKWDGSGVGYHILFMQQWAGGPRSCPGPNRIKQFNDVLVPWMKAEVEAEAAVAKPKPPASAVPPALTKPPVKAKPYVGPPPRRSGRPVGLMMKGDHNLLVSIYQRILGVRPDSVFGDQTEAAVKDFQRKAALVPDGIVGPQTARKLLLAYGYLNIGDVNASVKLLQWIAGEKIDGVFGAATKTAVYQLQAYWKLSADGVVGPATAGKIVR